MSSTSESGPSPEEGGASCSAERGGKPQAGQEPDRCVGKRRAGSTEDGDPVAIAQALVRVPSVNPALEDGGAGEAAAAALCAAWLDGWGFDVLVDEAAPGRPSVVARTGGEGPTLLLNGHLDTVGVRGMSIDPFGGELRAGADGEGPGELELWGRGACDMKGGVGALLGAAARLARSGSERPNLVVALTADEEHASIGMRRLIDAGIRADLAVVCEPTSLAVAPAHKGFVWARASFRGVAAHGSRPDLGIDAIRSAAAFLARLEPLHLELAGREPHPLLGNASFHAGSIEGGGADSVYPDRCVLTLERRTLPGEGAEDFMRELEAARVGLPESRRISIEEVLSRPATEVSADSPLVEGLLAACRESGLAPRIEPMTAWVDAAFLNEAGIPAVCFGPGEIARAHSADERLPVREVEECARALERFARDLCLSASS